MSYIDTSLQQNNAMGGIYSCSPYQYQYPSAAMPHNVDVSISNHPGEGISQLSSMSAYAGMNQPHTGYAFSNNGMNMPNSPPNWGSIQPMRMPTTHAPSTAVGPAFNFGPAANQHGTFQRDNFPYGILQQETVQQGPSQHGLVMQGPIQHAPVQHGTVPHSTAQYGNVQRGPVQHGNIQHGTEQHMLNPHELNQPVPGSQGPSVNPASSNSVPAPGNHGIETITDSDDLLGTVDPRDLQLIPEDNYGLSLSQWLVVPPQQSQAVNQVSNLETRKFRGREVDSHEQQYPDPAAQHEAHMRATQPEFPSITSHLLSPKTAPAIQEESRRHPDL